ncbi:NAD(P)H-binding protein [Croceicoccus sp. F390]|uniref:NAD(P)H-binding protein n=1 Tax=Croceicoccus esteveae TaxID=3075597 RepID=A0ABU2ZJA7_9SPHN|nr:NAD(P)H-binding protein [Croceicoccus sp. F390]MDT0575639.1 NAD(P)H-binding protein [Croceicoccus sp. F390]
MKLALTGATGFVGGALLELMLSQGCTVRALARKEQKPRSGVGWVLGDLAKHDALVRLCEGCDALIHVAGVVNARDAAAFHAGNVAGTINMISAARAGGVKRLVHVSSLAARHPQLSLYGQSKQQAEAAVAVSGMDWTIVRPPAVYGPGDTEMLELFRAARSGVVPLPPSGRASLIAVDDLARLLLACALQDRTSRQIYEPDDGRPFGWSHAELARAIGAAIGKRRVWPIALPAAVLRLAARADRLIRGHGAKLTMDRVGYLLHPDWVADCALWPPAAVWEPAIATRDGLRMTAQWYRKAGWL